MIHSLLDKYSLYEIPHDPATLLGLSAATVVPAAAGGAAADAGLSASTIAGMGLTGAGGVISALGSLQQGKTAEEVASYKATQDTINASQAIAAIATSVPGQAASDQARPVLVARPRRGVRDQSDVAERNYCRRRNQIARRLSGRHGVVAGREHCDQAAQRG